MAIQYVQFANGIKARLSGLSGGISFSSDGKAYSQREEKAEDAFLAILIACLGLFGLASFTAEQRTKEIGVRKVLGASVGNLLLLMSKEFTKWVLIANLLAWPIAYFVMKNWLQSFAYRTSLAWWIFISTGAVALVIALITVCYQSVKAALTNPVDALKYE